MEVFWVIVIGIIVLAFIIGMAKGQAQLNARNAYQQSLTQLSANPSNSDARKKTLELGRFYSNLTRDDKGVTLFDEVALMNDINAACGGATAIVQPQSNPVGSVSVNSTVQERLMTLNNLKHQGLISDTEYESKRSHLLDQL